MLQIRVRKRSGILWGLSATLCAAFIFAVAIYNLPSQKADAAGETISVGSTITGRVNQQIAVPNITINGSGNDVIPVNLKIGSGTLYMTTMTGLAFTSSTIGKDISFSGTRSNVNAALATLHYSDTSVGDHTLSVILAGQNTIFNPTNGHVYQYIGDSLTWFQARDAAAASSYQGHPGYLATITSQDENDFIKNRLSGNAWLGASDDDQYGGEDTWEWIAGPEAGTNFYNGNGSISGAAVGGHYANWAPGEPNNAGNEDCMEEYIQDGNWNDLPCNVTVSGYVVEYGDDITNPTDFPSSSLTITTTAATFGGGNGSVGAPYQLTDCEKLQNLNQNLSANYILTHNIDCTDTPNWNGGQGFVPIGNTTDGPFTGSIQGNGYSIDGLTEIRADDDPGTDSGNAPVTNQDYIGLIGYGTGVTVDDLHLTNAKIKGYQYVGGLIGFMSGGSIIDSSVNQGIDESDDTSCTPGYCVWARYGYYGGGLVGFMDSGSISGSTVGGLVKGSGNIIGGLVAHIEGAASITDSHSTAAIDGGTNIGGAVGEANGASLTRVYTTGNVIAKLNDEVGKAGYYAGGLVGVATSVTIDQSYATGNVHADAYYAGGLVGQLSGATITDSYATGAVTVDQAYAGGLVAASNYSTISRTYASGSVNSTDYYAGGLLGASYQDIINDSFSAGATTGGGSVGGFVGDQTNITLSHDYFDLHGTGLTDCSGGGAIAGCMGVNNANAQPLSFIDYVKQPFTQSASRVWVEGTWYFDGTHLPILRMGSNSTASVRPVINDNDGISTAVENAGPNGGDGNNDGTPDSEQPNVVSFVNPITNKYVTLEVDNACSITAATSGVKPNGGDSNYSYPVGLMNYTIDCGTPGFSTSVKIYYSNLIDTTGFILRKYNATTNTYATITSAIISGSNPVEVSYTITDGSSLDDDGLVNGIIVDPVGLASLIPPTPTIPGAPNTGLQSRDLTPFIIAGSIGIVFISIAGILFRRTLKPRE